MERESMQDQKSWSDTLKENLQNLKMTKDEFGEITDDQSLLKSCVDQCTTICGRAKV